MTRAHDQQAFLRAKRQQRLRRLIGQAIGDYRMIEEGDKVMECLSGGKENHQIPSPERKASQVREGESGVACSLDHVI